MVNLVFGTGSSPGIYDDLAKVIAALALTMAKYPRRLKEQHLDDLIAVAGSESSHKLWNFFKSYKRVCKEVGVRLAPDTDRDKMMAPGHEALVLGIMYETIAWRWWVREDKMARIVGGLREVIDCVEMKNGRLMSVVGRVRVV